MHGTVGVRSAPGSGSEFWFTVRVGLGTEQSQAGRELAGVQRPRPHPARLSALRILLVEDNPLNQEVALALLGHFGIQADLAANGAIAVEKVQQARYDLVLMDMQMPVMDGLAATRAIRALPGGQTLPIVAMTANAMASDRESCLAVGMNDHLGKPIDIDQLIARIGKWTKVSTAEDASTSDPGPSGEFGMDLPAAEVVALQTTRSVPLLDIEAGLKRSLNREALYGRTLKSFLTHFSNAPDKLASALAAADMDALTLAAHSLKGAAGQIGADQLSESARKLEASAKSAADADSLAAHLVCVRETTTATLSTIVVYLELHDGGGKDTIKH
jgi:two-component system sensor histidine kinase/response regulator